MTQPLAPQFDIARETTAQQILKQLAALAAVIQTINGKVNIIMSEDATVAAEAAAIEADQAAIKTALESTQALVVSLQAEVAAGNLSAPTLAALAQAQTDLDALSTEAQGDVTTDTPPAPAPSA